MVILKTDLGSIVENTGSPAYENLFVAAHNPVIVEFQRLDFQFISTTSMDSGNKTRLNLPVSNPNFVYQIGDRVPVFNSAFEFINFYTITDINLTTGSPTIDVLFGFLSSGSFNSQRVPNYRIEVKATGILPSTGEEVSRLIRATTNLKGELRLNLSGLLQSFLGLDLDMAFDLNPVGFIVQKDKIISIATSFEYREADKDFDPAFVPISKPLKAVNGAFQPGHDYNGYYDDYIVTNKGNLARSLTRFQRASYFIGYPFTVDFLFAEDDDISGGLTFRRGIYKDAIGFEGSGILVGSDNEDITVDVTRTDCVNRIYYDWAQNIGSDADYFRYFIELDSPKMAITIEQTVLIKRPTCTGYYLRWRNTLGGTDYWLFDNKANENFIVEGKGIYETFNDSIETLNSTGEWNAKAATDQYQMSTRIDRFNIDGIKDLLSSPAVQIWEGSRWETFLVQPQSFRMKASGSYVDIELVGSKIEKQIQTA